MYMMVDKNTAVKSSNLIGIFDLERTTTNHITRQFLDNAQKQDCVVAEYGGIPRSFIVLFKNGKQKIKLCIPSSMTIGEDRK